MVFFKISSVLAWGGKIQLYVTAYNFFFFNSLLLHEMDSVAYGMKW